MKQKVLRGFLIGIGISVVLSILFLAGIFKAWQNRFSDALFFPRATNPNIVIIAIDDKSIAAIGRFPWDRDVYAKLLNKLSDSNSKPAAIGIDVSFLEKSQSTKDNELAAAIKENGKVVLASEVDADGNALLPIDVLSKVAKSGIANTQADSDGITRSINSAGSFSYNIAQTYDNNSENVPGKMIINFAGPDNSYPTYSFSDVLNGTIKAATFKNKIVIIGATAADLHDNELTPTSGNNPMAGVEIQANAIETILDRKFLVADSEIMTVATIFVIAIICSLLFVLLPIVPMVIFSFLILAIYVIFAILSFDALHIRNIVFPVLAIVLAGIADIVYKYFSEIRQKRYIRKAFSYYLSESVLAEILSHPSKLKLGGTRQEITVLFSDVAGFTSISEKMDAEELARMLNNYLTRMTNVVFKYNGVLDKYVGDAVMAFWGAPIKDPDHAFLACQAALLMRQELKEIQKDWAKFGVEFNARIGINTGEMVVGNMGSHQRFDYTLLGDNVNLGSRLEGINKEYGTYLIISESTYKEVKSRVSARLLDTVAVKGKQKGIKIYELRGFKANAYEKKFLAKFEEARLLYHTGKFSKSLTLFTKLSKEYPTDNPTKVYIERLRILTKEKPVDWDGVFHAKSK